ncbi:hypothetical protein AV954_gp31 [Escherichia phage SSL-2009a]|uniref:Uncharacterized protein n=1 Tax=Escherichia phage SSL-2009a TaxID=2681619 RepID=T2DRQ0_9CAUD|nr:hypothetical protein AV954_gp31 [Escherichia phage SSL-2009a]AGV55594.1 hypothetical protein [Escherichia phage SSL-2009a]
MYGHVRLAQQGGIRHQIHDVIFLVLTVLAHQLQADQEGPGFLLCKVATGKRVKHGCDLFSAAFFFRVVIAVFFPALFHSGGGVFAVFVCFHSITLFIEGLYCPRHVYYSATNLLVASEFRNIYRVNFRDQITTRPTNCRDVFLAIFNDYQFRHVRIADHFEHGARLKLWRRGVVQHVAHE